MTAPDPETLFEAVRMAGIPFDWHYSDLYLPAREDVRRMVESYGRTPETFRSEIDGRLWLDVPFAYLPFWEAKRAR